MIPAIGTMIGCYIFTRMVSFCTRTGDRKESQVAQVFATLTAIVAVLMTLLLWGNSLGE